MTIFFYEKIYAKGKGIKRILKDLLERLDINKPLKTTVLGQFCTGNGRGFINEYVTHFHKWKSSIYTTCFLNQMQCN